MLRALPASAAVPCTGAVTREYLDAVGWDRTRRKWFGTRRAEGENDCAPGTEAGGPVHVHCRAEAQVAVAGAEGQAAAVERGGRLQPPAHAYQRERRRLCSDDAERSFAHLWRSGATRRLSIRAPQEVAKFCLARGPIAPLSDPAGFSWHQDTSGATAAWAIAAVFADLACLLFALARANPSTAGTCDGTGKLRWTNPHTTC
ncbi:MAG: hypothetical protein KatS3mg077_1502 [Candidatus Binatia bacterium]|nr:MAG: hypothetical protein KatS3mg077_1502 [Candidatus Binatia bacterium]